MVVSPEHAYLKKWMDAGLIRNPDAVTAYQEDAARKSEFERTELNKEKTGVRIEGVEAVNPVNGKRVPIFLSDYVLATYGTGAHHGRARPRYPRLGVRPEIRPARRRGGPGPPGFRPGESRLHRRGHRHAGELRLPGRPFGGGCQEKRCTPGWKRPATATSRSTSSCGTGLFSRQRYWGEPIPMVWCDKCGWQPLPESELPLRLPEITDFEPGEDGESPLARHTEWVNTTCPCCGGPARRETDTMPQWAGSSWYFLRYMDPHNPDAIASKEALDYWSPVDWYNGGMEHTTLHLLYSRFWHKFLYDIGGGAPPKNPMPSAPATA